MVRRRALSTRTEPKPKSTAPARAIAMALEPVNAGDVSVLPSTSDLIAGAATIEFPSAVGTITTGAFVDGAAVVGAAVVTTASRTEAGVGAAVGAGTSGGATT